MPHATEYTKTKGQCSPEIGRSKLRPPVAANNRLVGVGSVSRPFPTSSDGNFLDLCRTPGPNTRHHLVYLPVLGSNKVEESEK